MLPSNEINSMKESHASPCKSAENVAINPEINITYHEYAQSGMREITNALRADLLLGSDHNIGNWTVAVAMQQPANNRGMVFSVQSAKQQLNSNRGMVFSLQSTQ
jgi:hypothetical protein